MSRSRRWLQVLLLAALLPEVAVAKERILSFYSDIEIAADGSMVVAEAINVVAEGRDIRRGIYRDFPTDYRDRYGNHYRVDFDVLSVTRDGFEEAWHSEKRSNGIRVYIGDSDVLLSPGTYSYVLTYRTNRQLGFFKAHDELYWNVTGNGWNFAIERAGATVRLPQPVSAADLSLEGYTGARGDKGQRYAADVADGQGRIQTSAALPPRHGLTLVFTWPKGVVQEPTDRQRAAYLLADNLGLLLASLALGGSAWYLLAMWRRYGRDPEQGVVFPHYEPPEGYSPASLRYVRRMGYDNKAFTAAVINLAVKGYLEIARDKRFWDFGVTYTLTRKPSKEPLSKGEKKLLDRLFRSGSTLELDNENHVIVSGARTAHKDALKRDYREIYFKTNGRLLLPSIVGSFLVFALIGIAGLTVLWVVVISGFIVALHILFAWLMKAPSPRGRRLMDKSEGFKLYLEVAEKDELNLRNPPEKTPELFEAYLPFAIALGVEQAWAEQFSEVFARLQSSAQGGYHPAWYHGDFNASSLGSFSQSIGNDLNSAISSASQAPGSSSGSGGGGFSGGGGGGGGGGGW